MIIVCGSDAAHRRDTANFPYPKYSHVSLDLFLWGRFSRSTLRKSFNFKQSKNVNEVCRAGQCNNNRFVVSLLWTFPAIWSYYLVSWDLHNDGLLLTFLINGFRLNLNWLELINRLKKWVDLIKRNKLLGYLLNGVLSDSNGWIKEYLLSRPPFRFSFLIYKSSETKRPSKTGGSEVLKSFCLLTCFVDGRWNWDLVILMEYCNQIRDKVQLLFINRMGSDSTSSTAPPLDWENWRRNIIRNQGETFHTSLLCNKWNSPHPREIQPSLINDERNGVDRLDHLRWGVTKIKFDIKKALVSLALALS